MPRKQTPERGACAYKVRELFFFHHPAHMLTSKMVLCQVKQWPPIYGHPLKYKFNYVKVDVLKAGGEAGKSVFRLFLIVILFPVILLFFVPLICYCFFFFWTFLPFSGPEVIKLISGSTQLSMKFVLLINLKLLTFAISFLLN